MQLERLDANVSKASAATDHYRMCPGIQQRDSFFHRVVSGEPCIGQCRNILRPGLGVEFDHGSRAGLEKLGKAAIDVDAGEGALAAMHIVASATMSTKSA